MKQAGSLLMSLGLIIVLYAFAMDTTVSSSGTFIAGSYIGGGSTYNLGLLQQQMMVFQTGLASFLAGAFLYGSGGQSGTSVAQSNTVPLRRNWRDLQEGETEEEREERVDAVERRNKIVSNVIIVLIAIGIVLAIVSTSTVHQAAPMNVDENLGTLDANLADNLTSDVNQGR